MKLLFILLFYTPNIVLAQVVDPVIVSVVDQGILKLPYLEESILRDKSYDFNLKEKSLGYDYSYLQDNTPHGSFIAFKLLSDQNKHHIALLDVIYEHSPQQDYFLMFADSSLALYRRKVYYKKQTSKIIESWDYSVSKGAKVINFSSGSIFFDPEQISNWLDQNPQIVLVVSAGNDSRNLDKYPHYPCSIKKTNLFCVGSVNRSYKKSDFSNYGKNVLMAFGDHKNYKGTSFAAPEVSKFIASQLYKKKDLSVEDIQQLVVEKFGYFSK